MSSEETLRGLQKEAHQMKSSIKKHDNLVEKYKKKVPSSSFILHTSSMPDLIHQVVLKAVASAQKT